MESDLAASGDDLQPPWVDDEVSADDAGSGDDPSEDGSDVEDVAACGVVEVSDAEVLEHSPAQARAEVERLAEQVRRHAVDRQLFELVRADGFCGRRWRRLSDDLVRYGWAVLDAWLRTGYIFAKVESIGRPLKHDGSETLELAVDRDLREELCAETVARALSNFRAAAVAGVGWNPDGGASLTTFFVGACVQAFNNEFRRWSRHERKWGHNRAVDPQELLKRGDALAEVQRGPHMFPEPARMAADGDHFDRVFAELTDVERAIVQLTDDGFSQDEIGEALDMTPRAVEGRLYRLRQKDIRSRVKGNGDDG
ncbi:MULTISPECIES: sigma factor-like helix-turn-helix DNA-binding protein [unclassified Mycolicibacterium]|uniref:RNA polymerase sigma factor n=1 Tax=unclassified Mycolicibacterium TaxID=2636767 RepID=UPI0012DE793E|nr:sigma factor-like helix-turn-helix DNA-binding protein [Mycolicibacterium sp. CBMA 311]MUL69608.1 sigma-70 family RNA polymerase sigma factor [Mycolicibacterium sp. CBMA 311]MUL97394.1 sigma-70 family RNA polymerase sigma factor [Mycolicibacterium sp. CBMA 230]QGT51767.1 hypothetical protein pCBMA213_3_00025 [Mycolicibacterium sp.]